MNLLRILKYAAYTVGTLVLIGVLALVALAAFVDGAFVKARLQRYLLEHEHRTLSIEGEPELRWFPVLSVSLGRTELSEPDSRERSVTLDSAEVALRVLPLLAGELMIENLSARGVRIVVRERRQSRGTEPAAPKPAPEAKQELRRLLVRQIDLEDVKISYVDENTGRQLNVDDLALKLGPLADEVASPLAFSAKFSGRNPPVALDARATGLVKVGFARQSLAIEKLDARLAGNAGDAKALDVRLSGQLGLDARAEQLEINGLQGSASGMLDRDALQAKVSAPRIALTRDRAAGSAVNGTLHISGPTRRIDATLELAPVEGSFSALLLPRVAVALDAAAQGGRVKASLASALRANLREGSWELPDCSVEILASHPKLPQPFRLPLKASVKADRRTFSANASANAEEFDFLLKLDATSRQPLRAKFDFSSKRLNLDRYPVIAFGGGGKSDERLDLSGLRSPELQGKVRIGALQANGLKLADVSADLKLAGGALELPHAARLYGGALSGSLGARAGSNQVSMKEELRGVQIDPLLRDLAKRDLLEGTGDVNIDVAGSGATMPLFKRSLTGSARMLIRNGAYKGFNLGATLRGVQALAAGRPVPGGEPQKTEFTELSATFGIRRGVAYNEDLKLESPVLRSSGSGEFDIAASTLDYMLRPTLLAAGGTLAGMSVPVHIHGPVDALKYDVDTRAIVSQQLRGRALEQLNRQLAPRGADKAGSPQEQLRDTLRGLLGR